MKRQVPGGWLFGIIVAALLVTAVAVPWWLVQSVRTARLAVGQTHEIITTTQKFLSAIQDAETGQRGYLITGQEAYLQPYETALGQIHDLLQRLSSLSAADPLQVERIGRLSVFAEQRLAELEKNVALVREGRAQAAEALVSSDRGRIAMDNVRQVVAEIEAANYEQRAALIRDARRAETVSLIGTIAILAALVAVLATAAVLLRQTLDSFRQAEQRADENAEQLRVALDSLSQGISVFDADNRLIAWNTCFVELFSVPAAYQVVGTPYASFVRHDWVDEEGDFLETPEQLAAAPPEAAQRGQPIVYERRRKDGRTFEMRRTPVSTGGFVVTYTDITARLKTEAQLRASQRMEAVGQLTGGVAHDFNNLLTVVVGNLDLMLRDVQKARPDAGRDPDLAAKLRAALGAAERGAQLTRQLLAFARRQPLEPQPLDLGRVVAEAATLLRRSLGETVEIEAATAAGLWTVLADPAQLENLIINLALNARDAMPEGGRLTIELANVVLDADYARENPEAPAGQYVLLAVSDTGHGMPPDVAARAFDPFFTTKPEGKGTGLGLSQAYGFVKQSGGHIKIYSEVGHGTTVRVYLPRTNRSVVKTERSPVDLPLGTGRTILVVEDDEQVRRTVVAMLHELGYATIEAGDGNSALAVLATDPREIDLMFTDVVLPGVLRGRELADRARAIRPRLAIAYTSGYTQNAIIHHGRVDEGIVFLSKPYRKDDLARKLREALLAVGNWGNEDPVREQVRADSFQPGVVLIVEDEAIVRLSTLGMVEALGHRGIGVGTAAEALAVLDEGTERVDLVILDVGLPDRSGEDLAQQIREQWPGLPIIIASGYGGGAEVPGTLRLGKPYDLSALGATFRLLGLAVA
ncbi:CHASE3 domain-containing protein [Geminicoccus flavidas]|uniref:CHASE3 domain-containing protein n=1 Tax=Geminicoccus flavidas TaxID=2506407 RepID=UPI001358FBB8|nr:CHASE3 domain-containing protein [Geminicoccus flavidas]